MKKAAIIIIGTLVAIFVLSVVKDVIVKIAVEGGVEHVTGLKLRIKGFHAGLISSVVSIKDLKLYNPRSFEDRLMLTMPKIYVKYDLPAILSGDIHLRKVYISLTEFVVVKNKNGELNLNSLKTVSAQKEGKRTEAGGGPAPKFRIDNLHLKIGKAIYKDYSKGGEPVIREFNINIDETYTDITNPYALVSLIVVKALANTTIASLANFDINDLKGTISDTLSRATEVTGRAKEAMKDVNDVFGDVTKGLHGILK